MFDTRDIENYWNLGRWRGIQVWMHWSALLSFVWLYILLGSVVATLIGAAALFFLFIVHEFGHVIALRRRGAYIDRITFFGIHGQTEHAPLRKQVDEILAAWSGVAAQAVVLILTLVARPFLTEIANPYFWMVAGPTMFVFINFNIFLMLVALLPIGPFDGRVAWQVIPLVHENWRSAIERLLRYSQS